MTRKQIKSKQADVKNKLFFVEFGMKWPIGRTHLWGLTGTDCDGKEYRLWCFESKIGEDLEKYVNTIVRIDATSKLTPKFLMLERIEKAE